MTPFTPPSPGAWELEQTHVVRASSVLMAELFPRNIMRGFSEGTREYGVLLDHLEVAVINRFIYVAPRPVGAPKSAKGPPPRLVFKLLCALHPEVRRRIARAGEVFRDRTWRRELVWWDDEVKPTLASEARGLLAEDLERCSDAGLADHVRRAADFAGRTIYWHHRFNFGVMVPIGDFLVHVMEWTGLPAEAVLQTMRGLSPVSAGAVEELSALRAAIQTDPDAMSLLQSQRPPGEILAGLERRPAPVSDALRAYLDVVGFRVIGGYDVSDRHVREHPELLVKIIRTAAGGDDETRRRAAADEAIRRLREKVAAEHRAEFDTLLEESRLVYRLRDERVFHGDAVGVGILRRAVLAAGARLSARGRVREADQLVDTSLSEIIAMLEGRGGPSSDEIAERTRYRLETPISAAPARLGFPPSAPPPAEWLPSSAARMQRIVDLVLKLMFETRAPKGGEPAATVMKGFGVSPGVYEGPARVILDVAELPSVQQGEVLVAPSTGPTFNVVLPLIGAIVTERGGALSHAAIVAREYGLPGVVGCPGATRNIRTGMRVRVNGESGEVCPLG